MHGSITVRLAEQQPQTVAGFQAQGAHNKHVSITDTCDGNILEKRIRMKKIREKCWK